MNKQISKKTLTLILIPVLLVVLAGIVTAASLRHVPVGEVGVEVSLSRVTGKTYDSGWHFVAPFKTKVVKMSVQNQISELTQTQAELSGKEVIYLDLKLTYSLDSSKAPEVYKTAGESYVTTLMPNEEVFDIIKAVFAKYSIDDFAPKRSEILYEAKEALAERFAERGIIIQSLSLSNYNFSDELEGAITEMNQAAQELKTQEYKNQQSIAAAEAEAKVKKTNAEAEAEAILIKARAEAEANALVSESLTPELVQKMLADKWDGKQPYVVSEGGQILNLEDIIDNNS